MARKTKTSALSTATIFLFLAAFSATFHGSSSDSVQPPPKKPPANPTSFGSSAVFPVYGNVYPIGYYSVHMSIGEPPKVFDLDIDTGGDVTWVECDAPCIHCSQPPDKQYKPRNIVKCKDPICKAFPWRGGRACSKPDEQCDYEVEYADSGSSLGVVVKDSFPLRLTNGSVFKPNLAFSCGYDQKYSGRNPPPTIGVLGLGKGKASVVSQLRDMDVTKNVVGHCLDLKGGGYLFFGDDPVPSGLVWTPMLSNEKHYLTGPAEVYFNGKSIGVKGLNMVFDSGSSYTYLSSQPYQALVNLIRKDLNGKPLQETKEDRTLPICWKGPKPFDYFKPIALVFTKPNNVQLQISPEEYLIRSNLGNVCLGILNGSEVGLGGSLNVIGDNFMQNKMVVYDNEKQQIGWIPAICVRET